MNLLEDMKKDLEGILGKEITYHDEKRQILVVSIVTNDIYTAVWIGLKRVSESHGIYENAIKRVIRTDYWSLVVEGNESSYAYWVELSHFQNIEELAWLYEKYKHENRIKYIVPKSKLLIGIVMFVYKDLIFGKVFYTDDSIKRHLRYNSPIENAIKIPIKIYSSGGPQLSYDTLYVRGSVSDSDNKPFLCHYSTNEQARTYAMIFMKHINIINSMPFEDLRKFLR